MHSYNFIVELVIAVGGGQEGVPVCDEHVEQIHNLHEETVSPNKALRGEGRSRWDPVDWKPACMFTTVCASYQKGQMKDVVFGK